MALELVAQGNSLDNVVATVADYELPKGTEVRFEMDLNMPVASLFDVAGIEHLFSIDGVDIDDVWGEGWSKVVVRGYANSPTLAVVIAWIGAHWVWIVIGTFVLLALVSFIKIFASVTPAAVEWVKWVVIGFAVILGYRLITKKQKAPT